MGRRKTGVEEGVMNVRREGRHVASGGDGCGENDVYGVCSVWRFDRHCVKNGMRRVKNEEKQ